MAHLLITGATGMLGHYLLRDSLRSGRPTAVLVRGNRTQSAGQRVDLIVSAWERVLGTALPRPVVLEGDIHQVGLGLTPDDTGWVSKHCDALLHSAASVKFYTEAPGKHRDKEPYLSNVIGTRNVLAFCRDTGISNLHHISTAYVCGQQPATVYEHILADARFGNDYEASKAESETLVMQADHLLTKTIHRPSIIVGDSHTGYTSAFHTIYTALRIADMLGQNPADSGNFAGDSPPSMEVESLLESIGMQGGELKNLVPVDWVSSCITAIVGNADLHGRIYHLTNPNPPSVHAIATSMSAAIASNSARHCRLRSPLSADIPSPADFRWMMDAYRAYFCSDPTFDSSHVQQHLPHLPCPYLDRDGLIRLWEFALDVEFSSRLPARREENGLNLENRLSGALRQGATVPFEAAEITAALRVEGAAGGYWDIGFSRTGDEWIPTMYRPGDTACKTDMVIIIHDDDLISVLACAQSVDELLYSGALFLHAPELAMPQVQSLAERLFGILRFNRLDHPRPVSR